MLPAETCLPVLLRADRLEALAQSRGAAAVTLRACALAALAVAVLLVAALLPALCPRAAWAEGNALPQVTGSFDKESYAAGERAVVTFRVTNETGVVWQGVHLVAELPSTVKLVDAETAASLDREELAPGETMELSVPLAFDQAFFGKKLASTGDDARTTGVLVLALAAAFAAVALASFSRDGARSKRARATMSLLMSVVLVVGLAPIVRTQAHADEAPAGAATGAERAEAEASPVFVGTAACADPSVTVEAALTIDSADQVAGDTATAQVEVVGDAAVSAHARSFSISLTSDRPFASALSADTILLGGDFEGLTVASATRTATRTGDTTATIVLDGETGAAGARGYLSFAPGSFQDGRVSGGASVAVEDAAVSFDLAGGSYDEARSAFTIPVSVENARFTEDAAASDIVFADPAIVVTELALGGVEGEGKGEGEGVSADEAVTPLPGTRAELTVTVAKEGGRAQFASLAAALDADDAINLSAALDGAPSSVLIKHPTYVDGDGETDDVIATVDVVRAVPYGTIKATGVMKGEADDSGAQPLTVSNTVTLGVLDGAINLTDESQITLPGQVAQQGDENAPTGPLEALPIEITQVRPDGFDFAYTIPSDTVAGWYEAYVESGMTDAQAETAFLDELTLLMKGREIGLADGAVLNGFGIAQGACSVNLSDESLLASVGSDGLLRSDQSDVALAKTVFDALSHVISAVGYFVEGDIAQGISQIFGMIASMLTGGSVEYTLEDIYDELQQMKGQLTRLETSIDNIAIELHAIDKRGGFESDWYEVKWRMDHLNSYSGLYNALLQNFDGEGLPEDTPFAELSDDNKDALVLYKNSIDAKDKLLNTTVYADTMDLGSLIVGTGTKDVVSDYYQWIETYYNWNPETFSLKDVYLASMITSYLYGYTASMAYLSTTEETGTPAEQAAATSAKEDLKAQADLVIKKLAGTVTEGVDENGEPALVIEKANRSAYRKATEPLPNNQIRCLVNEHTYSLSLVGDHPLRNDIYAHAAFGKSVEKEDISVYQFNGLINLAQWQQMSANLPQVRKVVLPKASKDEPDKDLGKATSVYEEMSILGFDMSATNTNWETGNRPRGRKEPLIDWMGDEAPANLVAVSDANYNKDVDTDAVRHVRTVTIDLYDLKTGTVRHGVRCSRDERVYWVGYGWGYLHSVWPFRCTDPL